MLRARDLPFTPHPGWGLIKQVQDLLFRSAGPGEIKEVMVGEFDDFRDALR